MSGVFNVSLSTDRFVSEYRFGSITTENSFNLCAKYGLEVFTPTFSGEWFGKSESYFVEKLKKR
ncbi:MAG: hypothetical protein NPIRA03_40100 [Nitrospirales bacterium]|nr:MAG: hypothetical protein NPIRA03_40100 [Nitrospirales bacterium]